PDIVSLQLNVPLNTAYAVTSTIITKRRWLIADQRPPGSARREGNIEATARTAIMGFRDDIAIRITPMGQGGQGSRVDIRSASRVGQHDFGANASRVRSLMEDIEEAANNAPEPKPEPEPKAPVKKKQPEKRR
ncbi:MAG: DUF1499 domain-containing protein, partial [Pseudolabrys sp.]